MFDRVICHDSKLIPSQVRRRALIWVGSLKVKITFPLIAELLSAFLLPRNSIYSLSSSIETGHLLGSMMGEYVPRSDDLFTLPYSCGVLSLCEREAKRDEVV